MYDWLDWSLRYFSEFDKSLGRFVPSEELLFEYPLDFDRSFVTRASMKEIIEVRVCRFC